MNIQTKNFKSRLKEGQHGYITQSILDFVQLNGPVRYKTMDEFYQVELRGQLNYGRSSSLNHHLENLIVPKRNRRCKRYLVKRSDGLYVIGHIFTGTDLIKK